MIDQEFIQRVEAQHFRTDTDTGANLNALLVWNSVRAEAGMIPITKDDLPTWCGGCGKFHRSPLCASA